MLPNIRGLLGPLSLLAALAAASASLASAQSPSVRAGKYEVTLRIPEGGLYASEEMDVEFRVTDTTQRDPVEEGFRGVGGINSEGVVTMPSMPGMPKARPAIHREGIPGDYGIVLYFPHGGEYQIDLSLTPPDASAFAAGFRVDVQDEKPASNSTPPYTLEVIDWPREARAGAPIDLRMVVRETKSGAPATKFEVVHEKLFHLLLASADLGWFLHEHPEMDAKGVWSIPITFPAGGEYGIYGDVAPTGQGSRIVIDHVKVAGPAPTWNTTLSPHLGPTVDGGLQGMLEPVAARIPVGKMTSLRVRLTDAETGQPAGDTAPWLGAAGHLMIFHQDGETVVHSHPQEDAETAKLVAQGEVLFNARFPKEGLYKAYAQFQRGSEIKTLGFVVDVRR